MYFVPHGALWFGAPCLSDSKTLSAPAAALREEVTATFDGSTKTFEAIARIDTPVEAEYYRNGGILPYVLRQLAK